jgi:hypothetical protein
VAKDFVSGLNPIMSIFVLRMTKSVLNFLTMH